MRPATFDTQKFDEYVQRLLVDWKAPGIAVAIVDGHNTIIKNYGIADFESKRSIDDNTLFDCGSTSKSFTAAAVTLVLEDHKEKHTEDGGLFELTTPVSKLLPDDFQLADPYYTANVTVEDILSHRSGLPRHDDSVYGINARVPDSPRSITRNLRNLALTQPLRTIYQYCNLTFTVAAHLVSELSGLPFAKFLEDRIWNPLEMKSSYLNLPGTDQFKDLKQRIATGYYWSEDEQIFKSFPFFDQPEGLGAGSIFSTASDYAKWVRCMMRQTAPISPSSHKELIKPRTISSPETPPTHGFSHIMYALGWEVLSYRGHRLIGHDGTVSGFGSTMKYLPEFDWGIVIFSNGHEGANDCNEAIAMTLIDELVGVPQPDRLNWSQVKKENFEKNEDDNDDKDNDGADSEIDENESSLSLPMEGYSGVYYNKGYRTLRLQLKDKHLYADCTDRCFPFHLEIYRKGENKFRAEIRDAFDGQTEPCKVEFELSELSRKVLRLGIGFIEETDELVWFDKVDNI